MLGDHQIIFQTNLLIDLKNSDYGLSYFYLPERIDYGLQAFHNAKFLSIGPRYSWYKPLYRYRTWGVGGIASFPIDRFNRIDGSMMWLNLLRENLDIQSRTKAEPVARSPPHQLRERSFAVAGRMVWTE